jgi:putative DNA primase/helicase
MNDRIEPTSLQTVTAAKAGKPKSSEKNIIIHRQASEIKMKKINWLWTNRIARGKITLLSGNPGLGKSQIIAYMTGIITNNGVFADKTECVGGKVIILSAEDDAADTIVPRLKAVDANLTMINIIESMLKNNKENHFNLTTDICALENLLISLENVAAIFIDPLSAYLGNIDDHRNGEVRAILSLLAKLAEKYQVAIICITHHNKSGSPEALLRVLGSIGFVAASRAVLAVIKDSADESRRYFLPLKNNIGNDKSGLAFYIEPFLIDNTIATSRIKWSDEIITKTADEVLRFQQKPIKQTPRGQAKSFLLDFLAAAPKSVNEIKEVIEEAGYTFRTIERAKDELGVLSKKDGDNGEWRWHLPTDKTSDLYQDRQQ